MGTLNESLSMHQHYIQQSNVSNSTIFCHDNLEVLRGINSECINLIYLDPPFAKNETFVGNNKRINEIRDWYLDLQKNQNIFTNENFHAIFKNDPILEDVFSETDIQRAHYSQIDTYSHELIAYFDSIRSSAERGMFYYLIFMAIRLIELHRILTPTGSLYLHCDPTASHYLKIILDKIFGSGHFRNEIIWYYTNASRGKYENAHAHDIIFWYSKSNNEKQWTYNRETILAPFLSGMTEWRYTKGGQKGKDMPAGKTPDDVIVMPSLNAMAHERTGYPTQKPLALLERIVTASSREGDIVLDPFCGCATTCVAAHKLGRRWVGIDKSKIAYYMIYWRMQYELQHKAEYKDQSHYEQDLNLLLESITLVDTPADFPQRSDRDEQPLFYEVKSRAELKETRRAGMDEQYRAEAVDLLYEEQTGICNGCDAYIRKADLTLDHIVPRKKGGTDDIDNLQLLCYRCNNWKRTDTMATLVQKLFDRKIIPFGVAKKQMARYGGVLQQWGV